MDSLPSARRQCTDERGMDAGVQLHEKPESPKRTTKLLKHCHCFSTNRMGHCSLRRQKHYFYWTEVLLLDNTERKSHGTNRYRASARHIAKDNCHAGSTEYSKLILGCPKGYSQPNTPIT